MNLPRILVKKREGHLEEFDKGKLRSSLISAGGVVHEVEEIVDNIEAWAEEQWGKVIHVFEIEKKVIEHTRDRYTDVLASYLTHARNKVKPVKKTFNRHDIAQMLTSLFAIIQVYVLLQF